MEHGMHLDMGLEDSDAEGGSDIADLSSDHEDLDPSFHLVSPVSTCKSLSAPCQGIEAT